MKEKFTWIKAICIGLFGLFANQLYAQAQHDTVIQFSSNQQAWVYASTIDVGNRIISAGYFVDSGYVKNPAQSFSGNDSFDALVVCMDEAGNVAWKKTFGSKYSTWAMNVVCDNSGNYFVSGYFEKSFVLDGISFISKGNYNDFLMKMDHNGNVVWGISYAVPYAEFNDNSPTPMACDLGGQSVLYAEVF